jgi:hypothetical protein
VPDAAVQQSFLGTGLSRLVAVIPIKRIAAKHTNLNRSSKPSNYGENFAMKNEREVKPKKSLRRLYRSNETNERSPELIGNLTIQRDTFEAIAEEFNRCDGDQVACNIAACFNRDTDRESYLTVELSPPFSRKRRPKRDILAWLNDK